MRINRKEEFAIRDLMDFERLIVGTGENKLAVSRDRDGTNCTRVLLDDLGLSLDSIVPETNCTVLGTRSDQIPRCRHFDIIDSTLVSNKSEGAHGRLEVPDHNCAICRA